MENYQEKWDQCLALICKSVKDDWIFRSWAGIVFESYDPERNVLLLQVPNSHVYEFLEHYYVHVIGRALQQVFNPNVQLQYRLAKSESPQPAKDYLQQAVDADGRKKMYIKIPDARRLMETELRKHLGDKMRWLPAYDEVAEWLTDNRGRGLLCVGAPGLGKSLLCCTVLPAIIGGKVTVCSAADMMVYDDKKHEGRIDQLMRERCVVIDGLSPQSVSVSHYGRQRRPFFELCDAAVHDGPLLIVTTNLATTPMHPMHPRAHLYPDNILSLYGPDVISRLRAAVSVVEFVGEDMRK